MLSALVGRDSRRWLTYFVLLAAAVTAVGALSILKSDARWLGHGLVSVLGLVTGGMMLVTGSTLAGRLSRPRPGTYLKHRSMGILYGSLMVASLGLGLLITALGHKPLFGSLHGWLGLTVAALAAFQVVSSLMVRNRRSLKRIHRSVGYGTVLLTLGQSALGLAMGVTGGPRVLVVGHSTLGAMAAAAFIWVIVEVSQRDRFHLGRARFAAWAAAACIATAWLMGGYEYLTVYASQLKPVILAGTSSWAHRILMEAKEHLFLFLPVISGTLALLLSSGGSDQPAAEKDLRRAALVTASLALSMLVMLLVFGALISLAAHPAARLP